MTRCTYSPALAFLVCHAAIANAGLVGWSVTTNTVEAFSGQIEWDQTYLSVPGPGTFTPGGPLDVWLGASPTNQPWHMSVRVSDGGDTWDFRLLTKHSSRPHPEDGLAEERQTTISINKSNPFNVGVTDPENPSTGDLAYKLKHPRDAPTGLGHSDHYFIDYDLSQSGRFIIAMNAQHLSEPVPEPSTYTLMGVGALVLAGLKLRKRRQASI